MQLDEKDQTIQQLKTELEKAHTDHQEYKNECKVLEDFLEEETKKKEAEIKKLKEDAMKKEKIVKDAQSQLLGHAAEVEAKDKLISELTASLSKYSEGSGVEAQKIGQLENTLKSLREELASEQERSAQLQQKLSGLQGVNTQLTSVEEQKQGLVTQLEEARSELEQKAQQVESLESQLNSKGSQSPPKDQGKFKEEISALKKQLEESKKGGTSSNNAEVNSLRADIKKAHKEIETLKSDLSRSRQQNELKSSRKLQDNQEQKKLERSCKDLRSRVNQLLEEKSSLQQSFRAPEQKLSKDTSPRKESKQKLITFSAFLTTKKHYVSPFLEFNGRTIRVLKQNRNSFEKCLGSIKYTMDLVSYDVKELASNAVGAIQIPKSKGQQSPRQQPQEEQQIYQQVCDRHKTLSILIIGIKHTSKRVILTQTIEQFAQKLSNQADQLVGVPMSVTVYKNKLNQIPADVHQEFTFGIEQVQETFRQVLELLNAAKLSSPRKKVRDSKQKPKSQTCCVSVQIGDYLTVEFITSSNVSVIKEGDKLLNSLQNVVYHQLPFPSSIQRQYFCILTLNPIVQQYQSCRLGLSLVNQSMGVKKEEVDFEPSIAPMKDEFISETVKRRIQSCQKQSEQQSLKVQRMEQQIQYYRSRVEQVLLRIKSLISIQGKQNLYLRKSPVVLTLEKLQKSLLAIMQRSANTRHPQEELEKEDYNEGQDNQQEYNQYDNQQSADELV